MIYLDQQLHGYRNGHELLSTSAKLPRADQELIDRLSDIAGPLRPGEEFNPYITCYPLPSAAYYVVAITWQDLDAPRAGCVRTRSQLIPMEEWQRGIDVSSILEYLSKQGPIGPASRVEFKEKNPSLRAVPISENIELIEAIFLEERKPIVVFDAKDVELIAVRLLSSFWPSFRRYFALSTFALSPRTLGKRSFDLVFSPGDVRSRFSDWAGRRIDAKKRTLSRHRWSQEIAERIFLDDHPSLLRDDALGELASVSGGTEAELRISLLWNDLYGKLHSSPNAVLGLLDIANSRTVRNVTAIKRLEPEIGFAARRATTILPPTEAWRFLLALTAKLRDVRLRLSIAKSIRTAAIDLADRSPPEAINNVAMLFADQDQDFLLGAIGEGISLHFDEERVVALLTLSHTDLLNLLLLSPALADEALSRSSEIISKVAFALERAPGNLIAQTKRRLLRFFIDDIHREVVRILIAEMDSKELISEVEYLASENGLAAFSFHEAIAERAEAIQIANSLRNVIVRLGDTPGIRSLLGKLLTPVRADLQWILSSKDLKEDPRLQFIISLMQKASERQFRSMLSGYEAESVLALLMQDPHSNLKIIDRILDIDELSVAILVRTTMVILPYLNEDGASRFSLRALNSLLLKDMENDRPRALHLLLKSISCSLDGAWIYRLALHRDVGRRLFNENLMVLSRASSNVRDCLMDSIEDFAFSLISRGKLDISHEASLAMAQLMWDSGRRNESGLLKAAQTLLPLLWRSPNRSASPLIAVAFPVVYRSFQNSEQGPDIFSLFFFVDWDKCKTLRNELLDAFYKSRWDTSDVALAVARTGDVDLIFMQMSKSEHGQMLIADIKSSLSSIPKPWQEMIRATLNNMDENEM